ncbi:recombinase family protein [Pedobacter helvus]|uniref:Recombinase family protein n=1 Tax=Pedobacter helvus TaxID=2563444 RepID=A0ABW9JDG1_9SPHI|nr:recombinase family protein [Pedobacter ureilyticus]
MKKACLYIRVSTDEQAEKGFSQRDQHERLEAHCNKHNIKIEEVIFEDYSAKTFNRPQWTKMLTSLKRSRTQLFDQILFTKWDRFSRNTADAYEMIRILKHLDVEPLAIEQPLDHEVPESKTILAVYLSMPEVDNDRRSLNVMYGMRRGKKEGRWMGKALPGYANKCTEDGKTKYIAIDEPEASHMKWAFETLAKGFYATEHVWMLAKERGLKCPRTTFWDAIKNPCYCGKVVVPAFKDEPMQLVEGKHEALVSESIFYAAQDAMNGRKREFKVHGAKAITPEEFPLRGFLGCPVCGRMLTGSGSKGRSMHYYYYHCTNKCRQRHRVDLVNDLFEEELKKFIPRKGMAEVFKIVVCDAYNDDSNYLKSERKRHNTLIEEQHGKLKKAMELMLKETLTESEFKSLKTECEARVLRLEADLKDIEEMASHGVDIAKMANGLTSNLQDVHNLYINSSIEGKRHIVNTIFKQKWLFDGTEHRTGELNQAASLIYQINNRLGIKKTGAKFLKNLNSGNVPRAGIEPARFPIGV